MGWHALGAAMSSARDFVVGFLGRPASSGRSARAVARGIALVGAMACASSQAVTYSGLSVVPPGGAVAPGGSLSVKLNYTVSATNWPGDCGLAAVKAVELRKVGVEAALASHSYSTSTCAGDNNIEWRDDPRASNFTVALGLGTQQALPAHVR
jgi:hypothetical protein